MAQTAGMRRPSPVSLFGGNVPTLLYSDPAKGGDGRTRINPDKCHVKWEWIAASLNSRFPFIVPAGKTLRAHLTVGAQAGKEVGDFEASTFNFRALNGTTPVRVAISPEVRTPVLNRILSNVNLSSYLVSGTSQLPGLLPCSIFCLPKTAWFFDCQNLSPTLDASCEPVLFGRRYDECSPAFTQALHRRAEFLRWINPYWIGPEDPANAAAYTGPEVLLGPGKTAILTFPVKSTAGFLMLALLDDSTYQDGTGAGNLSLYADVSQNDSGRSYLNMGSSAASSSSPLGIDWSLLSCPSPAVVGMPSGGVIRAFSLQSPLGGTTNYLRRNTQLTIKFTSTELSNTIVLRPALFGYQIFAEESSARMSVDFEANKERMQQAFAFLRAIGEAGSSQFAPGAST